RPPREGRGHTSSSTRNLSNRLHTPSVTSCPNELLAPRLRTPRSFVAALHLALLLAPSSTLHRVHPDDEAHLQTVQKQAGRPGRTTAFRVRSRVCDRRSTFRPLMPVLSARGLTFALTRTSELAQRCSQSVAVDRVVRHLLQLNHQHVSPHPRQSLLEGRPFQRRTSRQHGASSLRKDHMVHKAPSLQIVHGRL